MGWVNDHERTDEADLQGEFNGVPGRREQPKQCPQTYDLIQYSNRPDLQKKAQKKNSTVGTHIEPAKQPNSSNTFPNSKSTQYHHKLQHKFSILNLRIKDKITVPIQKVH